MARERAPVLRELFRPLLLYIPLAFWTIARFFALGGITCPTDMILHPRREGSGSFMKTLRFVPRAQENVYEGQVRPCCMCTRSRADLHLRFDVSLQFRDT